MNDTTDASVELFEGNRTEILLHSYARLTVALCLKDKFPAVESNLTLLTSFPWCLAKVKCTVKTPAENNFRSELSCQQAKNFKEFSLQVAVLPSRTITQVL